MCICKCNKFDFAFITKKIVSKLGCLRKNRYLCKQINNNTPLKRVYIHLIYYTSHVSLTKILFTKIY